MNDQCAGYSPGSAGPGAFEINEDNEMDLKSIETMCETQPREVEFVFTGTHTGWFFTLLHESTKEVDSFMQKYNAKVRELSLKRKTNAINQLAEKHADDLRLVQVADWRWEKGESKTRPPFSKKELRTVLNNEKIGWHLKQFIDDEVGSLESFLAKSDSS